MDLFGAIFSTLDKESLVTVVVKCNNEEWNNLLKSPIRIYYNSFIKAIALMYEFDKTFMPGVVVDGQDALNSMIRWLKNIVSMKRYFIQYIRLTSDGALNAMAQIGLNEEDVKIFENILTDLENLKGSKK
ncbi:MAG: hypothetical protein Q6363_010440 [Candidatus Njordarchaeota archaeon]